MKLIITFTSLFLMPMLTFAQWQLMGSEINGGADNDKIGSTHALDIDSTGSTIAYGTATNSSVFSFSGYAQVMDWDGTNWVQRGDTIIGTDPSLEGTGSAVSLSADGMTVAVSSPWGTNSLGYKCGIVRVFDWDGNAWVLRGDKIEGEGNSIPSFSGDVFGTALDLSSDGNKIIIGARANTPQVGVNQFSGHARIYKWDGNAWVQIGQDIDGDTIGGVQEFGYAVSISDAGDRIAIGGRSYNTTDFNGAGIARMLEFDGTSWVQMGDTLFGDELGAALGSAIELTGDGNTLAVGAPATGPTSTGKTTVYDWNGSNWIPRGSTILGSLTSKSGQSIDLSHDGNIVVVGEPWASSFNGNARLFEWTGSSWLQVGATLSPTSSSSIEGYGSAVRINANGSRVIVGAPSNDDGGFNYGQINVYTDQSDAGVNDIASINLSIYPNPGNGVIHISADETIESIAILNMIGQEVMQINATSNLVDVDLSELPNGSYMARIQTQHGVYNSSVVKSN